ncbi:hypothetical protein AVEN_106824-1 [Araneus ventricosus]|uniref:Uncharacterized protein n=1 Tax=Araneus ventricosus TaxID=182803 RepID=A0A4Y2NR77_ARAVE|nr:hypothetical protein AVEN_106824-1 [Araneus ventricosus]
MAITSPSMVLSDEMWPDVINVKLDRKVIMIRAPVRKCIRKLIQFRQLMIYFNKMLRSNSPLQVVYTWTKVSSRFGENAGNHVLTSSLEPISSKQPLVVIPISNQGIKGHGARSGLFGRGVTYSIFEGQIVHNNFGSMSTCTSYGVGANRMGE